MDSITRVSVLGGSMVFQVGYCPLSILQVGYPLFDGPPLGGNPLDVRAMSIDSPPCT